MLQGLDVVTKKLEGARSAREQLYALVLGHLEGLHSEYGYAHKVWLREWCQISPEKRAPLEALSQSYRDTWLQVLAKVKSEGLIAADIALFRRMTVGALNWTVHWVQLQALAVDFVRAFLNEPKPEGATVTEFKARKCKVNDSCSVG